MNSSNTFKVVFISDIHFGAIKAESLYIQLKQLFLRFLKHNKVDMIVFGGDLFHNVISMNYNTSYMVLLFMKKLIEISIKNKIKYIRLIQGTMSHDNNQLHNFHIFENLESIDFKIILNVQDEKLNNGIKILYLPEEYIIDKKEYYKDYINNEKRYDFIFGHGLIDEVAYYAFKQTSENTMSKAPIFKAKELINSCRGPIYFGHIHTNTVIRKHIYYPGSFTRWKHGEEKDKGFYVCIYDKNTTKYITKFIVNDFAPVYKQIHIEINDNTTTDEIESIVSNIEADNIKLILDLNTNSSYIVDYFNSLYKNKNNVKVEVRNIKELKLESNEKEKKKTEEKYDFIFDKSLTRMEIIQRFIKIKYNVDIPLETIERELGRGE